jgi:hypothetical protein
MRDEYLCSGHPTLQDPAHIPEEFDDPIDHKALTFHYNQETYTLWLDLHDDFVESNQAMEERYSVYLLSSFRQLLLINIYARQKERKSAKRVG